MAKVTKSLKKSFPSGQKSAFDFDRAVAEAYEMFPHIDGSVYFVNAQTGKLVHPDPAFLEETNASINKNASLKKCLARQAKEHRLKKSSSCLPMLDDGGNIKLTFIFLYMEKDLFRVLGNNHTMAEERHMIFDHELGHVAIPGTLANSVKNESVADVYAALRHFQRYGTETGAVETLMQRRAAFAFIGQDALHFTSQALETALSFREQFDFKTLKPGEIASMAKYIGRNGAISRKELNSLSYHFNKLKDVFDGFRNDQPLRKIAERVFAARSPAVTKWGTVALKALLDKKISLIPNKRRLPLNSFYWDNVREAIKTQDNTPPKP
jgi:hypothetical protein